MALGLLLLADALVFAPLRQRSRALGQRAPYITAVEELSDAARLRFQVGDAVQCFLPATQRWTRGKVVASSVRTPAGVAPYQVQLDEGQRILLPLDNDQFIIGEDAAATQREECCEEEALALPGVCCDRKRETKFMR